MVRGWQTYGRGKQRKRAGQMSKLEEAYAQNPELQKQAGDILWWAYESWKFRLADRTWYTPDFMIMWADGTIEAHETKGFMEKAANIKIKVAADLHPIPFIIIKAIPKKNGGGFSEEAA